MALTLAEKTAKKIRVLETRIRIFKRAYQNALDELYEIDVAAGDRVREAMEKFPRRFK